MKKGIVHLLPLLLLGVVAVVLFLILRDANVLGTRTQASVNNTIVNKPGVDIHAYVQDQSDIDHPKPYKGARIKLYKVYKEGETSYLLQRITNAGGDVYFPHQNPGTYKVKLVVPKGYGLIPGYKNPDTVRGPAGKNTGWGITFGIFKRF